MIGLLIDCKGFTHTIEVDEPPRQIIEWAYIAGNPPKAGSFRKADLPIEGPSVKKMAFELQSINFRCAIYSELVT